MRFGKSRRPPLKTGLIFAYCYLRSVESGGYKMQSSTTPLEVTYLRTTTLKPDPRNPRVHSDKQVRQIAQSIELFGFNVPLLIDDEQKVIAGHGRLMAGRKMGWDAVPAIKLSHLTESQRAAFLIADNRLTV